MTRIADYIEQDFENVRVVVRGDVITVQDVSGFMPAEIGEYVGEDLYFDLAYQHCCDWFFS